MGQTVSIMNDVEFAPAYLKSVAPDHETRQRIEKLTSCATSEFVYVK
jgi:hypothetical protein